MRSFKYITLIGALGATSGCDAHEKMGLPNPASQNCIQQGGTLKIAKCGDGGEYGICIFEDNRQCEEWALFRGECPVGGLKISGILTPAATYCVLKGGHVFEQELKCQLPSGKICATRDFYNGKCGN